MTANGWFLIWTKFSVFITLIFTEREREKKSFFTVWRITTKINNKKENVFMDTIIFMADFFEKNPEKKEKPFCFQFRTGIMVILYIKKIIFFSITLRLFFYETHRKEVYENGIFHIMCYSLFYVEI